MTRSQTFTALVPKSEFVKRGLCPPLGATEAVLWGPRAEAEQRQKPKLGVFIDEQGATSGESFEGHHGT